MSSHYTLETLPAVFNKKILTTYVLGNQKEYLYSKHNNVGLFDFSEPLKPEPLALTIAWATTVGDRDATDCITPEDFSAIRRRAVKTREEQRVRTKDKAEVFTPTWICNLQNSLIDDVIEPALFNTLDNENQRWEATASPVAFPETYSGGWLRDVAERRLEAACGEAPYLVSPYNTVTGKKIPVLNEDGRYPRIGFLDRKLRVINENVDSFDTWFSCVQVAYSSIYGYEWQGDNLLLARLNLLNTFRDYFSARWNKLPSIEEEFVILDIISKNLWQMDGLRNVFPLSCSKNCSSCELRSTTEHRGDLSVIYWNKEWVVFEELSDKK